MKKTFAALTLLLTLFANSPMLRADFSDVPEDYYYYSAINYVQSEGIVSGHPDGTYRPADRIDRAAFTKIIIESQFTDQEIENCNDTDFWDVPKGVWYEKYVCVAQKNKVIGGYPDGSFGAGKLINLAEASKIIVEAFGYDVPTDTETWFKPYILVLEQKHALPVTVTGFEHELTRGELAEVAYRLLAEVNYKTSFNYNDLTINPQLTSEELLHVFAQDDTLSYLWEIDYKMGAAAEKYDGYILVLRSGLLESDPEAVEVERLKVIDEIAQIKSEILAMDSYEGDSTPIEVSVTFVDSLISILELELKDANDLYLKKMKGELSAEEEQNFESMVADIESSIDVKIAAAKDAVPESILDFLKANNLHLIPALNYLNVLESLYNSALIEMQSFNEEFGVFSVGHDTSHLQARRQAVLQKVLDTQAAIQDLGPFSPSSSISDSELLEAAIESTNLFIDMLTLQEEMLTLYHDYYINPRPGTQEVIDADQKNRDALLEMAMQSTVIINDAKNAFLKKY